MDDPIPRTLHRALRHKCKWIIGTLLIAVALVNLLLVNQHINASPVPRARVEGAPDDPHGGFLTFRPTSPMNPVGIPGPQEPKDAFKTFTFPSSLAADVYRYAFLDVASTLAIDPKYRELMSGDEAFAALRAAPERQEFVPGLFGSLGRGTFLASDMDMVVFVPRAWLSRKPRDVATSLAWHLETALRPKKKISGVWVTKSHALTNVVPLGDGTKAETDFVPIIHWEVSPQVFVDYVADFRDEVNEWKLTGGLRLGEIPGELNSTDRDTVTWLVRVIKAWKTTSLGKLLSSTLIETFVRRWYTAGASCTRETVEAVLRSLHAAMQNRTPCLAPHVDLLKHVLVTSLPKPRDPMEDDMFSSLTSERRIALMDAIDETLANGFECGPSSATFAALSAQLQYRIAALIYTQERSFTDPVRRGPIDPLPHLISKLLPDVGDKYAIAKEKHDEFVDGTRTWVFQQFDAWVFTLRQRAGVFAVEGVGGTGKSVIAAELCFRGNRAMRRTYGVNENAVTTTSWEVHALHFFKHDDDGKRDLLRAVGSLSRQLAESVEGFRIALESRLADVVTESELKDVETLVRRVIVEPANALRVPLRRESKACVLVIDALDECLDGTRLLRALVDMWPEMPRGWGLVVTARPADISKQVKPSYQVTYLVQTDLNNRADVTEYVRVRLQGWGASNAVNIIAAQADGLFIYARLVVDLILTETTEESRRIVLAELSTLSRGVNELYGKYFRRFKERELNNDDEQYSRILAPVVMAREPMPLRVWREVVMPHDADAVETDVERLFQARFVTPAARLLDVSGGRVRVPHKTMADFLVSDRARVLGLDVGEDKGDKLLAGACERLYQDFVAKNPRRLCAPMTNVALVFAVRHAAFHGMRAKATSAKWWVLDLERMFHWINGGVAGDDARWTMFLNDGWALVAHVLRDVVDEFSRELAKLTMGTVQLGRTALLVNARMLGGEVIGRIPADVLTDGRVDPVRRNIRDQALRLVKRIRSEEGVRVALPMGELSGLDQAGGALVMVLEGHLKTVRSVSFSPTCTRLVSGSDDKTVRIWDVDSGEELYVLRGHTDYVYSVSFSTDGGRIASGSEDKTVRVWDVESGRELRKFEGHTFGVISVSFSPRDDMIVSSSQGSTIRMWNVENGREVRKFEGHSNAVRSVTFSPDGHFILSSSWDMTIRIWDVTSGQEIRKLVGHSDWLRLASFSFDGKRVVSGSADKTVRVWDAESGKQLRVFRGHAGSVYSVAFSLDGERIVSCSLDRTLRVWDVNGGREQRKIEGHSGAVYSVSFSSDGKRIVSGSQDKTVRVWDPDNGKHTRTFAGLSSEIWSMSPSNDGNRIVWGSNTIRVWDLESGNEVRKLEGHSSTVKSVTFSPTGSHVLSGSEDGTLRMWHVESGKEIRRFEGHTDHVLSVAYSYDGKHIASGSGDKTVRLWNVDSGKEVRTFVGHSDIVKSVAFSPNGNRLASGSHDLTVRVWEVTSGEQIRTLKGHTDHVLSVSYSCNGKHIASGSGDKTVRVWDVDSGKEVRKLVGHFGWVSSVSFSADGKNLISGSWDNTVRVWDVEKGVTVHLFKHHASWVTSVAFVPTGNRVASGSVDGTVQVWGLENDTVTRRFDLHSRFMTLISISQDNKRMLSGSDDLNVVHVWDIESGKELCQFEGHSSEVSAMSFSPNGKFVASGSADNVLRVWEVETGDEIGKFIGHESLVYSVLFSPDGRRIASGSGDKTVRVWDVGNGKELRKFEGHLSEVWSVAFSPDGLFVVSGSRDRTLRVWNVESGKEVQLMGHSCGIQFVAFSGDGKLIVLRDTSNAMVYRTRDFDSSLSSLMIEPSQKVDCHNRMPMGLGIIGFVLPPGSQMWCLIKVPTGAVVTYGTTAARVWLWVSL